MFSFIIKNASDEEKCMFLNKNYLERAIENKNIGLIECSYIIFEIQYPSSRGSQVCIL